MNTQKTTSFPISFKPTGDPFVDAGGLALKFWWKKLENKSVLYIIEDVAKLYVNNWGGKVNALFLNSKITQPSYKGQARLNESIKLYRTMLDPDLVKNEGTCRICGNDGYLFDAGIDQFCLSGSAAFVNFHHAHEDGLPICFSCAVKLFCLILLFLLEAI